MSVTGGGRERAGLAAAGTGRAGAEEKQEDDADEEPPEEAQHEEDDEEEEQEQVEGSESCSNDFTSGSVAIEKTGSEGGGGRGEDVGPEVGPCVKSLTEGFGRKKFSMVTD